MLKKISAVLLTITILLSAFSFSALAEENAVRVSSESAAAEDGGEIYFAVLEDGADSGALKSALASVCPSIKFLYDYEIALDGFSFRVDTSDAARLTGFEGVSFKKANTYSSPEPLDVMSSQLIGIGDGVSFPYRGEGTVIAIIDCGFNTAHEIFTLTDESSAAISRESVEKLAERGLHVSNWITNAEEDPYVSAKIPFAYDYYYQTTEMTSINDHGDHVAAIAAGNKANVDSDVVSDGVAPEAQLLLMNIADRTGEKLNDANIFAAIEDAIKLGADEINLSLGSIAGFGNTDLSEEGYQRVLARAYSLGIDVVCAAGNVSKTGEKSTLDDNYGITQPLASDPDYSLLNDPATFKYSVAAASSVNSGRVIEEYIKSSDSGVGNVIMFAEPSNSGFAKEFGGKTLEYTVIPGLGEAKDYAGLDVKGKLALIERGTITFTEKVKNAAAAGAVGAIIYDNVESADLLNMALDDGLIPCVAIYNADGIALAGADVKSLEVITGGTEITDLEDSDSISYFSSWGVTTDLRLKPDVTAPGSYIYSAVADGYATFSGTSMATPHIAGALALIKQYMRTLDLDSLADGEFTAFARTLLMNTAVPLINTDNDTEYSPRAQGAGRVDVDGAIRTKAIMYGKDYGAKLELGDKLGDSYTLTFTVRNLSSQALDYYVEATAATDGSEYLDYINDDGESEGGDWFVTDDATVFENAVITLDGSSRNINKYSEGYKRYETIRIPANSTKKFTITVTLDQTELDETGKIFTSGFFVDGFIRLIPRNEGSVELSMPYMGFYGDWSAVSVFDESGDYYGDMVCTLVTDGDAARVYQLGGNLVGESDTIDPGRYIISTDGDGYYDCIALWIYLKRNCVDGYCYILDSDGNTVSEYGQTGLLQKAYYDSDSDAVVVSLSDIMWDGSADDNERYKYPDGDYTLVIKLLPDYGETYQTREIGFTVDTAAPTPGKTEIYTDGGRTYLKLTATDENYIAMINVYEPAAINAGAEDEVLDIDVAYEPDEDSRSVSERFDITGYSGRYLYAELLDYAMNSVTIRIEVNPGA